MQMTWERGLKAEGKENREISVTENNNKKKKVHSADKEDKREGLGEGKKGRREQEKTGKGPSKRMIYVM